MSNYHSRSEKPILPEDFHPEILKRLPAKTLLRFRCVCKWWKQFIDSHSFVQQHLSLQIPQILIESDWPRKLHALDPHTLPSFDTLNCPIPLFHLIGTLHGVVCLHPGECSDHLYLWNPTLRKLSELLLPQIDYYQWFEYHDENHMASYSSFWIDPSTKDFKIIIFRLFMFDYGDLADVYLYSSIRKDWKVIPSTEIQNCKPLQESPAVMIEGVAHWKAQLTASDESVVNVVVMSFDFVQERFNAIIEAPSARNKEYGEWFHPVLTKSEDTLSLVYMDSEKRCDVYSRQGGSWVNIFRFDIIRSDISRVMWVFGEIDQRGRVLGVTDWGLLEENQGELVLYDIGEAGCIPLKSKIKCHDLFTFMAYDFVESLLFPSTMFGWGKKKRRGNYKIRDRKEINSFDIVRIRILD